MGILRVEDTLYFYNRKQGKTSSLEKFIDNFISKMDLEETEKVEIAPGIFAWKIKASQGC